MGQQADLVILARMDNSGLGYQTRNLVRMLNPDRVVAIDFSFYNKFEQHHDWYEEYNTKLVKGFLNDGDVHEILEGAGQVLTAETFYNNRFIDIARAKNVKTLSQINYEFFEPLSNRNLQLPHKILMPSYWKLEEIQGMTAPGQTIYLPPPTFTSDFDEAREVNMSRSGKPRFLHVAGKMAAHDRAGTLDLMDSLRYCTADFELVIKVQSGSGLRATDSRITLDFSAPDDQTELYRDFDAMIQPRRYAGLNLPMNEALASGLPVIMTDISPNNRVLPKQWLVRSHLKSSFKARTRIELYSAEARALAHRIDEFALSDSKPRKEQAYQIAVREYAPESLYARWDEVLGRV